MFPGLLLNLSVNFDLVNFSGRNCGPPRLILERWGLQGSFLGQSMSLKLANTFSRNRNIKDTRSCDCSTTDFDETQGIRCAIAPWPFASHQLTKKTISVQHTMKNLLERPIVTHAIINKHLLWVIFYVGLEVVHLQPQHNAQDHRT